MTEAWANFFISQCGDSAALLGLLFVSVSLNLSRILAFPDLPNRALMAMLLLLAVLIVASLMLIPGQPMAVNGVEVLCVGLAICAAGTITGASGIRNATPDMRSKSIKRFVLLGFAILPYIVAGIMLLAGHTAAFYWLAGGTILSFVASASEAWVLLVEINR
jgi:hypothetical protein